MNELLSAGLSVASTLEMFAASTTSAVYRSGAQSWITNAVAAAVLLLAVLPHLHDSATTIAVPVGCATALFLWLRVGRAGVYVNAKGARIVNPFTTRRLPWSQIAEFRMRDRTPFPNAAEAVLSDGRTVVVFGIQRPALPSGSVDHDAQDIVDALNRERLRRQDT